MHAKHEHPAVCEAAVVGVTDEAMGEEVGAAITIRPGADTSADEIRAFVKELGDGHVRGLYGWRHWRAGLTRPDHARGAQAATSDR
jgi:acyl-CoA synthetase (AMP-forming)/AMP-acid ligase II